MLVRFPHHERDHSQKLLKLMKFNTPGKYRAKRRFSAPGGADARFCAELSGMRPHPDLEAGIEPLVGHFAFELLGQQLNDTRPQSARLFPVP